MGITTSQKRSLQSETCGPTMRCSNWSRSKYLSSGIDNSGTPAPAMVIKRFERASRCSSAGDARPAIGQKKTQTSLRFGRLGRCLTSSLVPLSSLGTRRRRSSPP